MLHTHQEDLKQLTSFINSNLILKKKHLITEVLFLYWLNKLSNNKFRYFTLSIDCNFQHIESTIERAHI